LLCFWGVSRWLQEVSGWAQGDLRSSKEEQSSERWLESFTFGWPGFGHIRYRQRQPEVTEGAEAARDSLKLLERERESERETKRERATSFILGV
jgi:hypothetical protein